MQVTSNSYILFLKLLYFIWYFIILCTLFYYISHAQVKKGCIGDGDGFTVYVKKAAGVAVSGSYKYANYLTWFWDPLPASLQIYTRDQNC